MGSIRGETMSVRRHVVYPVSGNPGTSRRRDVGETTSTNTVRSNNLVGSGDGRVVRQRSSSSSRGYQSASPSPSPSTGSGLRSAAVRGQTSAVTTSPEQSALKSHRGAVQNGWTRGRLQSDVFTFASDTEATSSVELQR